jgi:hypothetical protein
MVYGSTKMDSTTTSMNWVLTMILDKLMLLNIFTIHLCRHVNM